MALSLPWAGRGLYQCLHGGPNGPFTTLSLPQGPFNLWLYHYHWGAFVHGFITAMGLPLLWLFHYLKKKIYTSKTSSCMYIYWRFGVYRLKDSLVCWLQLTQKICFVNFTFCIGTLFCVLEFYFSYWEFVLCIYIPYMRILVLCFVLVGHHKKASILGYYRYGSCNLLNASQFIRGT